MSRHRNVRTLNYDEEYETVYDVYGQSVEDECCISPTTAAEFMYDRNSKSNQSMSAFLPPEAAQVLEEEDEDDGGIARVRADSMSGLVASLGQEDQAKLMSCVEEMQNIVGDTIPESQLAAAAMQSGFNLEASLDSVLSKIGEEPKPQRIKKEQRTRNREFDCDSGASTTSDSDFICELGNSKDDGYIDVSRAILSSHPSSGLTDDTENSFLLPDYKEQKTYFEDEQNVTHSFISSVNSTSSVDTQSSRNPLFANALSFGLTGSSSSQFELVKRLPLLIHSDLHNQPLSSLVHGTPEVSSNLHEQSLSSLINARESACVLKQNDDSCKHLASDSESLGFSLFSFGMSSPFAGKSETRLGSAEMNNLSLAEMANLHLSFMQGSSNSSTTSLSELAQKHTEKQSTTVPGTHLQPTVLSPDVPLLTDNQQVQFYPQSNLPSQLSSLDSNVVESGYKFPTKLSSLPEKTELSVKDGMSRISTMDSFGTKQSSVEESKSLSDTTISELAFFLPKSDSIKSEQSREETDFTKPASWSVLATDSVTSYVGENIVESGYKFPTKLSSLPEKNEVELSVKDDHSRISTMDSFGTKQSSVEENKSLSDTTISVPDNEQASFLPKSDSIKSVHSREETDFTKPASWSALATDSVASYSRVTDILIDFVDGTKDQLVSDFEARPSAFAAALCRKEKQLPVDISPVIDVRVLLTQTGLECFLFNTPSPDDIIKTKQKGAVVPQIEEEKPQLSEVPVEVLAIEIQGEKLSFGKESTESNTIPPVAEKTSEPKKLLETGERRERKSRSPSPLPNGRDSALTDPTGSSKKSKSVQKNSSEEYVKERGVGKPLLNLVVIGHVDAGKSTLMGHLLYRLGCVSKRAMHKYEQDSKKLGKASFMYAWVLDETAEERNRGITMDVAQSKFETSQRSVTLLDAPGHKDFIPNMITGAAQADVAILVVDATRGEFETGFEAGGQTREHTVLVRSLGVSQLAVVVNKLDNVDWSEHRYREIVAKLSTFLKQVGFKESDIFFVPCSGLTGENLTSRSTNEVLSTWYDGPCLVDVIDGFSPPERPVNKPFRMCIADIFKGTGSGFCVGGRVESGHVVTGDRILVMPATETATVKTISMDEIVVPQAFAGDHVTLSLSGVDQNKVASGDVVCDIAQPIKASSRFQARVVLFNMNFPLTKGFPVILHYQSMNEQAVVRKILTHLHKSTGEVLKKKPRCLLKNSSGEIELEVNRPICIEAYRDFKDLGRFMLRSCGTTIAAGMITKLCN